MSAENSYVCYVAYIVMNNFEKVSSSLQSWKFMSVL